MATTIDQITEGDRIRVTQQFTDHHGRVIAVGQRGKVLSIDAPWNTQIATFVVQGANRDRTFSVDLRATSGPRHGHMRDFISSGRGPEGPPDPPVVVVAPPPPSPPPAPKPQGEWDQQRYRQAVARVTALADAHDFSSAETAFSDLMMLPRLYNEYLPMAADHLEDAAARFAKSRNREAFDWLYERAVEAWHYWAGQATSGGEGTALMLNVTRAQHRHKDLRALYFG